MKIQSLSFQEITFTKTTYAPSLKASLMRMGLGFPIKVKRLEDQSYECVDGHKRMSAIADILQDNPSSSLQRISVLVINDARSASGTTMNHH